MTRFRVQRTITEVILVEAEDADSALTEALESLDADWEAVSCRAQAQTLEEWELNQKLMRRDIDA